MAWRGLINTKLLTKGFVKQKLPAKVKFALSFSCLATVGLADTQKTLPFGTPEDVYREARERIDIFNANQTRFVFNSIHNIQSDVPVENILAMFKAVDDARRR